MGLMPAGLIRFLVRPSSDLSGRFQLFSKLGGPRVADGAMGSTIAAENALEVANAGDRSIGHNPARYRRRDPKLRDPIPPFDPLWTVGTGKRKDDLAGAHGRRPRESESWL